MPSQAARGTDSQPGRLLVQLWIDPLKRIWPGKPIRTVISPAPTNWIRSQAQIRALSVLMPTGI